MNKKGFTLVEILVTIGLLALLGVGIGVSLNNVLKNQEENTYEAFIEKIKSSTLLYSSNSAQIVNDLEFNNGYILISMNDLINGGYIRENVKNPNTNQTLKELGKNEKGEDYSKARVYYSMDKEMIIDYPFIKPEDDVYLNVINYTTLYKSNEDELCYKGLNTSSLGLTLVESGGLLNKDLVAGNSIIAYMEDGSKCTDAKLNTSTVGTYKIRYVYTIDGTNAENNLNAKSAVRNITIKPTKPTILEFDVAPQTTNDVYIAHFTGKVRETGLDKISYCFTYDTKDISKCKNWKTSSNKNSNNEFTIDVQNVDLKAVYPGIENNGSVSFYLFVKNDFEEYASKKMSSNNGVYYLTSTVVFNLEAGSSKVYLEDMNTEITGPIEIRGIPNVPNKTKFSTIMTASNYANNKYNRIVRSGYYFDGWYTEKNGGGTKYTKDTATEVFGFLNLYASWKADSEKPTCTISASSSGLSVKNKNDNFGYPVNGSFDNSTLSNGPHTYTFIDWASNVGSCSATISDQYSYQDSYTYWVEEPYQSPYSCEQTREVENCTGGGSTPRKVCSEPRSTKECRAVGCGDWSYYTNGWQGPGCYIDVPNGPQTCETVTETYWGTCYETLYRDVEKTETYTVYDCHSGSKIPGTYKCIS